MQVIQKNDRHMVESKIIYSSRFRFKVILQCFFKHVVILKLRFGPSESQLGSKVMNLWKEKKEWSMKLID